MDFENLEKILSMLTNILKNNNFNEDEQKVQYFCDELYSIKTKLPTIDKLEKLQKIEIDLETKYDEFNELSYYFTPLYIKFKNKIHNENVKKLREANRGKRDIK